MTACQKIGLQFAFPLYLLSIVVMIIVVCKAGQWPVFSSIIRIVSGKVSLLIGNKTVPVLSTLFLLSYTKFLRTSILIIHSAIVIKTNCTETTEGDCYTETTEGDCTETTEPAQIPPSGRLMEISFMLQAVTAYC